MKIKQKLKEIRLEKKYGICKLSKLSNVSVQSIYYIEQKEYLGDTSLKTMLKLAIALEVKLNDLFEVISE